MLVILASLILRAPLQPSGYPINPLRLNEVKVTGGFWGDKLSLNAKKTIYHEIDELYKTGRVENFEAAAGVPGAKFSGYFFNDSDVYKVIEAASYSLQLYPDPDLEKKIDDLIVKIQAAQMPDGYLHTAHEAASRGLPSPVGKVRWVDEQNDHELYCAGHLYEGAVAYYEATGKRSLLDVAIKNANLVCSVFKTGHDLNVSGHEEIEIGLVKLYRATGDRQYLNEARWLIDQRGAKDRPFLYGEYAQDDKPVVDQTVAEGHAVRATYLYSGMADVAAEDNLPAYWNSLDKIWDDVVNSKIYVTGGIGSTGSNEGFSAEYDLPNTSAYCETCASVSNSLWNQRMFQESGDAKYVDVMERTLYNAMLSGVGQDGTSFFYPNVLESIHGASRSPWFDCACCPPNVARALPTVATWLFAKSKDTLYANLFAQAEAKTKVGAVAVDVLEKTDYPWSGAVSLMFIEAKPGRFKLAIRIPGWARGQAIDSSLYKFKGAAPSAVRFLVNGKVVDASMDQGYAVINRVWRHNDTVEFQLPMNVNQIVANDAVGFDHGQVAVQRGPLVYCAEFADQPDKKVLDLALPSNPQFTTDERPDLLGGIVTIKTTAEIVKRNPTTGAPEMSGETSPLTLIPYNAWANRGRGAMEVWIPTDPSKARPAPLPTIASTSKVTTSVGWGGAEITDQIIPANSIDHDHAYLHWWPRKGTKEWVQFDFNEPHDVSKVKVYWFQDEGVGECRLPASWTVLVHGNGEWSPIKDATPYVIKKDGWCEVDFSKVEADGLKIEIQLQPQWSTGIHQVEID